MVKVAILPLISPTSPPAVQEAISLQSQAGSFHSIPSQCRSAFPSASFLSFDGTIIVLVAEVSNFGPYTFSLLTSSFAILSSGPVPSIVLAVIPWPPLGMWPSLTYHLSPSRTWPHLGSLYYSGSSSSKSMIVGTHWENSLLWLYYLHVPLHQLVLTFFLSLEACEINCFDSFLLF